MENLSLNNQQFLQIATRDDNDDYEISTYQHVFNDIQEDLEKTPIKRRYTRTRDLRAVSQNQIIGEPSQ